MTTLEQLQSDLRAAEARHCQQWCALERTLDEIVHLRIKLTAAEREAQLIAIAEDIENRIIYRAPVGTKAHTAAKAVWAERIAAYRARMTYTRSKGAKGYHGSDSRVKALLFKERPARDAGYCKTEQSGELFICKPNKRHKLGAVIAAEIAALPKMPGSMEFTNRIGADWFVSEHCLALCHFDEVKDEIFILVPKHTPGEKPQFEPEGCEKITLSAYYAAKGQ